MFLIVEDGTTGSALFFYPKLCGGTWEPVPF